jgi:tetratricopeptide (TPR) repeat protein
LRPNSVPALTNLGAALAIRGDLGPAAALERALLVDSGSAEAHNNYANVMVRQGKLDAAIVHNREALRLNPNLTDARRNLELVVAAQDQLPAPYPGTVTLATLEIR